MMLISKSNTQKYTKAYMKPLFISNMISIKQQLSLWPEKERANVRRRGG